MIRAQSRNLSLSMQAIPFGLIVGKLAEYANYPHLYYRGRVMGCVGKWKHSRRVEFLQYDKLMNRIFPMTSAVISLIMWFQLNITILVMTAENLGDVSRISIFAGLILAFVKAQLKCTAPVIVMYFEGKQLNKKKSKSLEEEEAE